MDFQHDSQVPYIQITTEIDRCSLRRIGSVEHSPMHDSCLTS